MSKSAAIAEALLRRVRTGEYRDKVPGERALAQEFQVNFKTANRAVAALVDRGVLIRKRGEGTFVAARRQRQNLTIGLAFYKYTDPGVDPVFTRFFAGVNAVARAENCRVDVTAMRDTWDTCGKNASPESKRRLFCDQVLGTDPDGVLVLGNPDPIVVGDLLKDRPGIAVGHHAPDLLVDNVRRDVRAGVQEAVELLVARGHRRIAFATYNFSNPDFDLQDKARGYEDATAKLGYRQVVPVGFPAGATLAEQISALESRPTAVVAAESTLGLALVRHAAEWGLHIPQDLAVISFDDGDAGMFTQPPMSSIHAYGEELGRLAVNRLLARLDGTDPGRIEESIPCEFIERESSLGKGEDDA